MTLAVRIERLRAMSVTAGYRPQQVLMGAAERAELNEITNEITNRVTRHVHECNEPATYLGLIIVDVAAPYCLMVGTVTKER